MRTVLRLAAVLMVLAAFPAVADMVGKARVVDGDTIEFAGRHVDLYGVDAPEPGQTCEAGGKAWDCGREATFALAFELAEHWVTCKAMRSHDDGVAAVCYVGPHDLGAVMVSRGWALAERSAATDYVPEESWARQGRRGLWRGRFVEPWAWRAGERLAER